MTDDYVSIARRSIRRSLFQRFKTMGLSQDQLNMAVATATRTALDNAGVADLVALAAAAAPLRDALATAAPEDPALQDLDTLRDRLSPRVLVLLEP